MSDTLRILTEAIEKAASINQFEELENPEEVAKAALDVLIEDVKALKPGTCIICGDIHDPISVTIGYLTSVKGE